MVKSVSGFPISGQQQLYFESQYAPGHCIHSHMMFETICREGKFPTYHKLTRHTTKSTKYSQLQSTKYCCQVLLSLLKNQQIFTKYYAKTNHTSARVSDDTSSPARVSDDTSSPARVSDDICGPIRLWHLSPIRLRHVSLTHP